MNYAIRLLQVTLVLLALAPRPALADSIVFQTKLFRYEISASGKSAKLVDLCDGHDYIAQKTSPMAILIQEQREHEASAVRQQGDNLYVSFEGTDTQAIIHVEQNPEWLVFELIKLSDAGKSEELIFPNVCVSIRGRKVAVQAGCVSSDRFTIGCQALNLQTQSHVKLAGLPVSLMGHCYRRFGLEGARVALFAAPKERVLEVIEAIETAEPQVPHVELDGVWARISPDSRKSYLFIDMTEANADEVIRISKSLNFGYVLVYASTWAESLGSYRLNAKSYPHGMEGLKAVAAKAHAAGIKVGIHCLTGFVSKRDPLATPRPDSRLAKDGSVILAADIDVRTRFIPTEKSPADFPADVAYGLDRQGFDVQIDDEIISYRSLATKPPFGLDKCIRGAYGARRTTHHKGAIAQHLTQRFSHYLVDCDTDLSLQVARRYADVINECKLDMIYFDGAGSNRAFGPEWAWRYVPQIPLQSAALWQRDVRVGGSCSGPLYWHLQSFKTCNDFVEIGVKRFLDHDKLRAAAGAKANYIPVDLGWWGLHKWAPHRRSTTPDEIEYICQKALGFDTCWSLETSVEKVHACGRWPDIREIIATYEKLRLADSLSERVKAAIRRPGAEFKLVNTGPQKWNLVPICYGPGHLGLDSNSCSWMVANDLGVQPLRMRLYAIPVLSPYDDPDNPVLLDQRDPSQYVKKRTHEGCRTTLSPGQEKTPAGDASILFSAESSLADANGWAEHRADLVRLGQRIAPPALIEGVPEKPTSTGRWARPLGVWVYGDGKGEVLNVQLRSANGGCRDHYVTVDFKGWRYCELTRPESDRVFDFSAGYNKKYAVRHFQYDQITAVFLRFNSIPAKIHVQCSIGPIKALREHWLPLKNPTITINGQEVVFPCQLKTEQYLEYGGKGEARLFDREGVEVCRVEPRGVTPVLREGRNQIMFSSTKGPTFSQRAEISIVRIGKPL